VSAAGLLPLEQGILVVVDQLTRDGTATDGEPVADALRGMGIEVPNGLTWRRTFMRLRDAGYLKAYVTGGGGVVMIEPTQYGRALAAECADASDPFEGVAAEARTLIASDLFRQAFPAAFEPWADAERLLRSDDCEAQLSTIGHKVREATQHFATAAIARYGADDPDPDVKLVKKRLGAVVAHNLPYLSPAKRKVLESLGDLWEGTVDLIQRQEHSAQKEGEPVNYHDGRRVVMLTMFLMTEYVSILDDRNVPDNVAVLE
jgi:hypothetical protein